MKKMEVTVLRASDGVFASSVSEKFLVKVFDDVKEFDNRRFEFKF